MFHSELFEPAIEAARRHAIEAWPNEACGIIHVSGTYIPFRNMSPEPTQSFDCHRERMPFFVGGEIAAMIHSHPYEKKEVYTAEQPQGFGPSAHDMRQQIADGLVWGIIGTNGIVTSYPVFWGDDIPPVPLLNRQFRHGPTGTDGRGDCYALIKDAYKEKFQIDLPEGPRDAEWWHRGGDLYLENMSRAGFYTIRADEAEPGDVFFAQINSGVPNHGGVLLNGGLILHHLYNRSSREEPLIGWRKHIVRWIRHEKRSRSVS